MGVFKQEKDYKRVIFNVDADLAERLEQAKERSRSLGRKLDVDTAVDKALEKFLKKAEKKLDELEQENEKGKPRIARISSGDLAEQEEAEPAAAPANQNADKPAN
ncbi:MAG: hypothetical protein ACOCWR_06635 [Oceanidesulfovibrio sp.]